MLDKYPKNALREALLIIDQIQDNYGPILENDLHYIAFCFDTIAKPMPPIMKVNVPSSDKVLPYIDNQELLIERLYEQERIFEQLYGYHGESNYSTKEVVRNYFSFIDKHKKQITPVWIHLVPYKNKYAVKVLVECGVVNGLSSFCMLFDKYNIEDGVLVVPLLKTNELHISPLIEHEMSVDEIVRDQENQIIGWNDYSYSVSETEPIKIHPFSPKYEKFNEVRKEIESQLSDNDLLKIVIKGKDVIINGTKRGSFKMIENNASYTTLQYLVSKYKYPFGDWISEDEINKVLEEAGVKSGLDDVQTRVNKAQLADAPIAIRHDTLDGKKCYRLAAK